MCVYHLISHLRSFFSFHYGLLYPETEAQSRESLLLNSFTSGVCVIYGHTSLKILLLKFSKKIFKGKMPNQTGTFYDSQSNISQINTFLSKFSTHAKDVKGLIYYLMLRDSLIRLMVYHYGFILCEFQACLDIIHPFMAKTLLCMFLNPACIICIITNLHLE